MKKEISSEFTPLYKIIISIICFLSFLFGILFIIINKINIINFIPLIIFIFLIHFLLIYFFCIKSKKVTLINNEIEISSYKKKIIINKKDIDKVTSYKFFSPIIIILKLKNKTEFGKSIIFYPKFFKLLETLDLLE